MTTANPFYTVEFVLESKILVKRAGVIVSAYGSHARQYSVGSGAVRFEDDRAFAELRWNTDEQRKRFEEIIAEDSKTPFLDIHFQDSTKVLKTTFDWARHHEDLAIASKSKPEKRNNFIDQEIGSRKKVARKETGRVIDFMRGAIGGLMVIESPIGFGKSSLIDSAIAVFRKPDLSLDLPHDQKLFFFEFQRHTFSSIELAEYDRFVNEFQGWMELAYPDFETVTFIANLKAGDISLPNSLKMLIVIDGLDDLLDSVSPQVNARLLKHLSRVASNTNGWENIKVIATARRGLPIWFSASPVLSYERLILPPFDQFDCTVSPQATEMLKYLQGTGPLDANFVKAALVKASERGDPSSMARESDIILEAIHHAIATKLELNNERARDLAQFVRNNAIRRRDSTDAVSASLLLAELASQTNNVEQIAVHVSNLLREVPCVGHQEFRKRVIQLCNDLNERGNLTHDLELEIKQKLLRLV